MGAVVVAAWLVEAKQSVVENMAPVLTRVFTPLTTADAAGVPGGDRGHAATSSTSTGTCSSSLDLILVLVLGLLLYAISARDPQAPPAGFDRLQLLLVISALAVDLLMLAAMLGRIAEFGAQPEQDRGARPQPRPAGQPGLVGLAGVGFVRRRRPFAALERWQTSYLPVYAAWAAVVVVVFPLVFDFA